MSKRAVRGLNDLETINPKLAKEWHPTLNNGLLPSNVTPGSNKTVYWQCPKCNYVWPAKVNNRAILKSIMCKYCPRHLYPAT